MVATQVSSTSNASLVAPRSSAATGSSRLGKDEFLKLLITQLANQDPVSPQSSDAFVAQLAQFATVEAMGQSNVSLEKLLMAQTASNQTGLANLVGKDVRFASNSVVVEGSRASPLDVRLDGEAAQVVVTVKDAEGKIVRREELGARSSGHFTYKFDGRDNSGAAVGPGTYTVEVAASRADASPVSVRTEQRGRVDGISFIDGVPTLLVGSLKISLNDVVEILQATPPAEPTPALAAQQDGEQEQT